VAAGEGDGETAAQLHGFLHIGKNLLESGAAYGINVG
jgi:hypothetical protein